MKNNKKQVIVIGLTGGAGSGKSTVAKVFQRQGACIIDADKLGHQMLDKKSPCFAKVVKAFGPGILSGKSSIDRVRLGEMVFSDPAKLRRLNRIVHPALLREINRNIRLCRKKYSARPIVLDAALIVPWGLEKKLDRLVMVDSRKKLRLFRVMDRGVPKDKALRMLASQVPVSQIKIKADIVIPNNGTIAQFKAAAALAWRRLTEENVIRK
jgi:dephospho-CoA kinase